MYTIAILRYRSPVEEVAVHQDAHRAYLRTLQAAGLLIAAGPQSPRFGGMLLLRIPDDTLQATLDDIRDKDPYYIAGVVQYEFLPWNIVIGKEALDKL